MNVRTQRNPDLTACVRSCTVATHKPMQTTMCTNNYPFIASRLTVCPQVALLAFRRNSICRPLSTTLSARTRLLQASLQQVTAHGWTQDAISAAVEQESLPLSMVGMISPTELVEWFMQDCNQRFATQLDQINMDNMDIPERIAVAIQARLEYVIPVVQTWHQGMALGAVQNSITTAHQLEEIVTLISRKVGPPLPSAPLERTALGALYVATELHLLTDTSHAYEQTWNFLKGRVGELHLLAQRRQQNPMSLDSVVAASAVATSLVGGLVSLAQPTARGMAYSVLPQFMSMVMPTTSNTSTTSPGSSPQDYSDLPPFPHDANSK